MFFVSLLFVISNDACTWLGVLVPNVRPARRAYIEQLGLHMARFEDQLIDRNILDLCFFSKWGDEAKAIRVVSDEWIVKR